jgi:hypothetical protein
VTRMDLRTAPRIYMAGKVHGSGDWRCEILRQLWRPSSWQPTHTHRIVDNKAKTPAGYKKPRPGPTARADWRLNEQYTP